MFIFYTTLIISGHVHALDCIGHNAADQLQVDEVMSCVSES